jgi:DNA invertase Pin-like site-specific DNA recombinase
MMTKARIYARFSPRRNEDECESIEAQIETCTAYCERQGYTVEATFEDRALSGDNINRPGLWSAIDNLSRGEILVVYRFDRLARDVFLSEVVFREIEKKGARVESVDGAGNGDTPEQRLLRQILQTFAEYERRVIGIRTKAAMLRHQANGRRMSSLGRLPYGMRPDPQDDKRMIEDPGEQAIIQSIVERHKKGASLRGICTSLENIGIKCRGRKSWRHGSIKMILKRAGEI